MSRIDELKAQLEAAKKKAESVALSPEEQAEAEVRDQIRAAEKAARDAEDTRSRGLAEDACARFSADQSGGEFKVVPSARGWMVIQNIPIATKNYNEAVRRDMRANKGEAKNIDAFTRAYVRACVKHPEPDVLEKALNEKGNFATYMVKQIEEFAGYLYDERGNE